MAQPAKPKDAKPKLPEAAEPTAAAEAKLAKGGGGGGSAKFFIGVMLLGFLNIGAVIAAIYVLAPMVLVPAIVSKIPAGAPAAHGEGDKAHGTEAHAPSIGLTLPLSDFTVNLSQDPALAGSQFLRAKLSLAISVPEEEDCNAAHGEEHTAAGGGGHGGGAPAGDPCMAAFQKNMDPYIPTIRDIINTALMKRTASTLGTVEGQELLKDDIRLQINPLLGKKYSVLRVNFEEFIVQR